jgi:hypothetical protein
LHPIVFLADGTPGSCLTLEVCPGNGPNDGFLKLITDTHNGRGISVGSVLSADFGEFFVAGRFVFFMLTSGKLRRQGQGTNF